MTSLSAWETEKNCRLIKDCIFGANLMYRRSLLRMGSTIAPKKRLGATLGATLKVAKIAMSLT